ncbi:MAG: hypothetical protein J0I07_36350 [Myxococcales bacterium]|nr:hypothetical protein [Myxococcales bacterium]
MSNISGVSGAVVTTTPSLEPGAGLDGETILLYCQSQLNDLNSEIKAKMAYQREVRAQKEKLNELRTLLTNCSQNGLPSHMSKEKKEILEKYAQLIQMLPPGSTREALQASFDKFRSTSCYNNDPAPRADVDQYLKGGAVNIATDVDNKEKTPDVDSEKQHNTVSAAEVSDFLKQIDGAGEELGKNAELEMIGLQQLISQRQMAVQMATNMMAKTAQCLEAVVGNVGK